MQIQPLPAVVTLKTVAGISPEKEWLCHDLKVIPKSKYHFHFFGYLFVLLGIDLEASRKCLLDIRTKEVKSRDTGMVLLYNRAVRKFNEIYPEHPLEPVVSETLTLLVKECIRPVVDHFPGDCLKKEGPCSEESIRACLWDCDIYLEKIRDFEACGGKVVPIAPLARNRRYEASIGVGDQLFSPVCHAGLIRSPTVQLILRNIKHKLGANRGQESVLHPHGLRHGYDPNSHNSNSWGNKTEGILQNQFEEAFGIARADRFGKQMWENYMQPPITSSWQDYCEAFKQVYYKISSENGTPKVFVCLGDTGLSVIWDLVSHNLAHDAEGKVKRTPDVFKNISIVLIPEDDWISNCYIPDDRLRLFCTVLEKEKAKKPSLRKNFADLSQDTRREVFFAMTAVIPKPDDLEEKLSYYYSLIGDLHAPHYEYAIRDLFKTEAFRAAYWRWSGLFQGVGRCEMQSALNRP